MLHEEIAKYRELSGDTNPNTPISRIGGYLDGYERALEQQTCEDAISRQAVLDIFADNADATRPYSTAWKKIRDLPSVNPQPKTGWIPLTKRHTTKEEREYYKGWPDAGDDVVFDGELPENNQEVIVSYGDDVRTDIFCKEDGGYHFECVDIRKVEAWMLLPEPYRAEREE